MDFLLVYLLKRKCDLWLSISARMGTVSKKSLKQFWNCGDVSFVNIKYFTLHDSIGFLLATPVTSNAT